MINKVSLTQDNLKINSATSSVIMGKVNDCVIKYIKVEGIFPWHAHDERDKMIYVLKGCFKIYIENREIVLNENEGLIIPRGLNHSASAPPETWVLVLE